IDRERAVPVSEPGQSICFVELFLEVGVRGLSGRSRGTEQRKNDQGRRGPPAHCPDSKWSPRIDRRRVAGPSIRTTQLVCKLDGSCVTIRVGQTVAKSDRGRGSSDAGPTARVE